MSAKTTIVLVVLAVLGTVVMIGLEQGWFGEKPESDKPTQQFMPQASGEMKELFEDHPAEVTRLVITSDDQTVAFAKDGEDWKIVEPVEAPALKWEVEGLVRTITSLSYQQTLTLGDPGAPTEAKMGLAEPTATVSFDYENGSATVTVGRQDPLSGDTYVRLGDGATVYLIKSDLATSLDKDLSDFRDEDLIKPDFGDIVGIELEAREPALAFKAVRTDPTALRAGRDWVLESPVKGRASMEGISDILSTLTQLEIQEFVEDGATDLGQYGLADPAIRLTLTARKEVEKTDEPAEANKPAEPAEREYTFEKVDLLVGDYVALQKEHRYAKLSDSDVVVAIKQARVGDLTPELTRVRDTRVTPANTFKITKMVVTDRTDSVTLEKADNKWQITSPQAGPAERQAVQSMITSLRGLNAVSYVDNPEDLGQYGLASPRLEVKLYVEGEPDPETVRIGGRSQSGRMLYVQRVGDESVAVVKVADAEGLLVPAVAFGDRRVLSLRADQIDRIEIARDGMTIALEKQGWQWQITSPSEGPADPAGVSTIIADVASLMARSIAGKGHPAAFELDAPRASLAVRVTPTSPATTQPTTAPVADSQTHTVLISKVADKVYAKLADGELIYELDPIVFDHVTAELNDRQLLRFAPMQVTGLAIEGAAIDEPLAFAKTDDAWTYPADEFFQLDGDVVDGVVRDLRGLQAQRFVDLAANDLALYGLLSPAIQIKIAIAAGSQTHTLMIAETGPKDTTDRYAVIDGTKRVFVLTTDQVAKFEKALSSFEKQ